ncbi:hypothetical protein PW52_02305 [Tamlana sedimentorum]|uniref:Uncharacterized protein n=2 Tax=Neotamlana sedimentorum TaxID=1435349 RepID=A0A0D7WDQ2_9FLAO|nr:hypothetical protein PW52_02305 [Tamlana sedimentorum]
MNFVLHGLHHNLYKKSSKLFSFTLNYNQLKPMAFLAILNFIISALSSLISVITGVLLIRHRQVIFYFKSAFSFIKDDYVSEEEINYNGFFKEAIQVLKFGVKSLGKSSSKTVYGDNQIFEISILVVLLGKVLVFIGFVGIVLKFIGTIWMLSTSHINIDIFN